MRHTLASIIAASAVVVLAGCSAPGPTATVTVPAPATTVTVLDAPPSATPTPSETTSLADRTKLFLTFVRSGDHPEIDKFSDAELIAMAKDVCSNLADGQEFTTAAVNAIFEKISDPDSFALVAGAGAGAFCPQYTPSTTS